MAIKRDVAEKLMSEKGNLISSSFSVIPDGFLGLADTDSGCHLAVVCGEKSEWNKAWKGAEFETVDEHKKIKMGFPGTASGRLGGALFLRGKRYQRGFQRLAGCDKQPAAQFVCS